MSRFLKWLLAVLMLCSPLQGQELTVNVPATNPVYTLIEIESTGDGTLTVIDKEGKIHSAYKCGDKYLFTGPPNQYLISYLKFVEGDWKIVNEPFSIGGDAPNPPDNPGEPVSYRDAIKNAIPANSSDWNMALMYVPFRIGLNKLQDWGANSITEQEKLVQTQIAQMDEEFRADWTSFLKVWVQATKAVPQNQWPEAWTITTELLSKELPQSKPISSKDSVTSKKKTQYTLASYTPPIPSSLMELPSIKSSGTLRSLENGTQKQNDYSTSAPVPTQTLPETILPPTTTNYSVNCGQRQLQTNCSGTELLQVTANCGQTASVQCSPIGQSIQCGSGQMQVSAAYPANCTQRYTVRQLQCGQQYAAYNSCGQMQSQVVTYINMQPVLMDQAGCSLGSTYQVTGKGQGPLRAVLTRLRRGRAARGASYGRRAATNWGMVSGCRM